jgi:uncharacterized protein (TIGR00730 family)
MSSICVYCGSSVGRRSAYAALATELGAALAHAGHALVYGAGNLGLMGAVADAVLAHGGTAIGVIPQHLVDRELAHQQLSRLHVVDSMHERKAMMAELSDAFIALPGGMGTLEELAEILTWAQLDLHTKPVVVLNQDGYYDHLLRFLDHASAEGFLAPPHRALLKSAASVDAALAALGKPGTSGKKKP